MPRKEKIYQCEDCEAVFNRPWRLAVHVRTHTGERPFVCEYEDCDKSYSNLSHLKRHEVNSHKESHKCPVDGCSEILKSKDTLNKHINNIHKKKKQKLYKCTECNKDFNKRNWLQSHMVKEHGAKWPIKCPIKECGKEFLLHSRLKRHMRIHNKYKCKVPGCEEVLLKWSVYITHLRQFHPKVHKCDTCEKVFFSTSNLKTHKEVHKQSRTVFPCDVPNCSRFYFAEKNLIWHARTYHDARPFTCDIELCHRAFKTQDELDCHKLLHIRRKRQKKKKPCPNFSAVLSGCADPRKFTRRMPPKRVATESSDEFTTDEEATYDQDTSIQEGSHKNSDSEAAVSKEENHANPSQQPCRNLSRERVGLQPSNDYLSVVEDVHTDIETPDIDNPHADSEGLVRDKSASFRTLEPRAQTDDIESSLGEDSDWEPPSKLAKLITEDSDFSSNARTNSVLKETISEKLVAVASDRATNNSGCISKHKTCLDDSGSASEYETITVLVNGFSDKYYSESDEMSSCLSDVGG